MLLEKGLTLAMVLLGIAQIANSAGSANFNSCASQRYQVREIPFFPNSINDSGTIVGTTIFHHAATWSARKGFKELPTPGSFHFAEAVGINNSDEIIVNASDAEGNRHQAFIYSHGSFLPLAGSQSIAHGINDLHVIVGEAIGAGENTRTAVVWANKTLQPVSVCCGSTMKAINKGGVTIGDRYDSHGKYHAFLRESNAQIQSIGPEERYSSAIALNDSNHVVLQAFPDVYLYQTEGLVAIKMSKFLNRPLAISNCDVIIGSFGPYSDKNRAFIWDKIKGFQDLNDLIPANSEWKLEVASGINTRGQIIGRGDYKDGDDEGFLLIPE